MEKQAIPAPTAADLIRLARRDRRAAEAAMAALDTEAQAALVCETPVQHRTVLLELAPDLESLVPSLPEAELCFTAKTIGLADAGWLLEHASPEQLVACVDLDAWHGTEPAPANLAEWLTALANAGDAALRHACETLDMELLLLYLKEKIEVVQKPTDEGWEPAPGFQTLDGQFYFRAWQAGDDLTLPLRLFHSLFRDDYWQYFRLLQGVLHETESHCRIWAERWRIGRLQDLGFPPREETLELRAPLPPHKLSELPKTESALENLSWKLPVWQPQLPTARDARQLVFRAAADLGESERSAFFYTFLSAANAVAVLEELPLGDVESTPRAIERTAELTSRGLEHLVAVHPLDATALLRRVSLERLLRIGFSLERNDFARASTAVP